jgi:hypothetical protein
MERFLYRLANSSHADRFILKGALLLAWHAPQSRSTVDIDLEGRLNNDPETMSKVMRDVCRIESIPDGIRFDPLSKSDESRKTPNTKAYPPGSTANLCERKSGCRLTSPSATWLSETFKIAIPDDSRSSSASPACLSA